MMRLILLTVFTVAAGLAIAQDARPILEGEKLAKGFDIGVDTEGHRQNWLETVDNTFRMSYPSNQSWGAVFVTVGPPVPKPRPSMDFSAYRTLIIEMRGAVGGEKVFIGIKSNAQGDNGSEVKVEETLTSQWRTYSYLLERFRPQADITKLYVVAEFVFDGEQSKIIYVKNIRYLR